MGRARGLTALIAIAMVAPAARADEATLDALLRRADAVAHEVARVRGLPLKHPVPNDVVDRDELRRRLLADLAKEKTAGELAAEGFAFERWGLIPLNTDYQAMIIDLLTEQIAGYYDSETKKLTISKSAGDDASWAEMVLAHELDHALQDQAYDLHHFEDLPDDQGDASLARHALVEGDGIALMLEVVAERAGDSINWADSRIPAMIEKGMASAGSGTDKIDRAPLAIRESLLFPYRAGLPFVAALRRHQPWRAVDAAFARPPKSTEQILHPERYLADEAPIPVTLGAPAALPGFSVVHTTVWGELGFDLWLRSHGVDEASAAVAAAGWGGDRAIVVARPDEHQVARAVGIVRSEWDTEADAIEAAEAAGKALADSVVGATVERTPTRMRLFGVDGTVSWLDRHGASLVIVLGAPAWSADALASELWTHPIEAKPPARPGHSPSKNRSSATKRSTS